MAAKSLPDLKTLNKFLECDPEKGFLFWKSRPRDMFPSDQTCIMWNNRYAEKPAFRTVNHIGYLYGQLFNARHFAHRVIWKMTTGEEPGILDHINGIPDDNRIANLRTVDHVQNMRNRKLSANNSSGANGVDLWQGKFRARTHHDGRSIHIGMFDTLEEAIAARKAYAEQVGGFTPDHGER